MHVKVNPWNVFKNSSRCKIFQKKNQSLNLMAYKILAHKLQVHLLTTNQYSIKNGEIHREMQHQTNHWALENWTFTLAQRMQLPWNRIDIQRSRVKCDFVDPSTWIKKFSPSSGSSQVYSFESFLHGIVSHCKVRWFRHCVLYSLVKMSNGIKVLVLCSNIVNHE